MFEDVKKQDDKVVVGDPGKAEDVFAATDPSAAMKSALQEGKIKPASNAQGVVPPASSGNVGPPQPLTHISQLDDWSKKKSKKGLVIIIILSVILIGGVAWAANFFFNGSSVEPSPSNNNTIQSNTNENMNANINSNINQPPNNVPPELKIDADGDGLTDLEEQALGTDPNDIDTDSDGLNDKDEYRVHKTDPINSDTDNDGLLDKEELYKWSTNPSIADTDGDGYLDGEEVLNGFNPNGAGKLPLDIVD